MDETDQRVASLFTKKSHQRNISVMYIVQNLFHHRTISLIAQLHGSIPKPDRRIADYGASTPNVSQENAFFPGSFCQSYSQTSWLHGDRYETKHAGYPEIKNLHLSRWGTESVCRVIKMMLHPVSCHSCMRIWGNNMVSQRLKMHGSDISYLQRRNRAFVNTS